MEDAKKCAELIALLTAANKLIDSMKLAGIQVTGQTAATKESVLAWVKDLATIMADKIVAEQKKPKAPIPKVKQTKAPIRKKGK
jgi:hypothetical protein